MNFLKIHFFSIIRVPKSIYNCQISLLAPADLSGCPRHMWAQIGLVARPIRKGQNSGKVLRTSFMDGPYASPLSDRPEQPLLLVDGVLLSDERVHVPEVIGPAPLQQDSYKEK